MIYFAHAAHTGLVKIGYTTTCIWQRLNTLQTGCPTDLDILGIMPGEPATEKRLHEVFAHLRSRGEWFRLDAELLHFIGQHTVPMPKEFGRLMQAEPALADLYLAAQAFRKDTSKRFCANAVWYGYPPFAGLKPKLLTLVGWTARNPNLRTQEAYDLAYETIYKALPDCRNCCCYFSVVL